MGGYFVYCGIVQYAPLPASFSSFDEVSEYAWHLKFPSIGLGFLGGTSDRPGESIRLYTVELLFREKDRVFVVARNDRGFRMIDEFVLGPTIRSVELKQGKLRYLDSNGRMIVEHDSR